MKTKYFPISVFLFLTSFFTLPAGNSSTSSLPEKDYIAYLFTYFTGNEVEQEAIHYAVSYDGFNYKALNNNQPVIASESISSTGGVRDPHILRCEDGKTFYMVVTDMTSSKGWDSNRAMVLMRSEDLVTWTSSVVNIQEKYEGQEELKRVWAPQTIYDPEAGKYMVYFSMKHGEGPDILYYAYANSQFTDLEGMLQQLFFPVDGKSCIDADIVWKDGTFYMFYKTEGHGNGIRLATTTSLTSGKWVEKEGYKQQTREAVEGPGVFRLINSNTYILMYDVYMKGGYEFTESRDLETFRLTREKVTMDFYPRHGTVIPITKKELKRITDTWGVPQGFPSLPQNPVLEGYYADPEILYALKTGKYYIYPTSDGFPEWGSDSFSVFSSSDLKAWEYEGVILDLKTGVSWAERNAWAPCLIEKEINGTYAYYYYFTAAQKIGVAVSDDPAGPFTDSGKPLVERKPDGVMYGQEIDPDVFTDPRTGKNYLYWGNGYAAVAELNDDMVSLKQETIQVITPDDTFREGIYVFYRNGIYYFMWSENDTRSPNYRVRYGTSDFPTGPIRVPEDNLILSHFQEKEIYGTGHNSVIQVPGTDEWYIVYHRFSRPNAIHMGEAAGYHREICIDKLEFNEDGSIKKVVPTI